MLSSLLFAITIPSNLISLIETVDLLLITFSNEIYFQCYTYNSDHITNDYLQPFDDNTTVSEKERVLCM